MTAEESFLIVVRRALTVPLALLLLLVLAATLLAHRANETVLNPSFIEDRLATVGVFDAVHDEVLPQALGEFLANQDEQIPDNLAGIALPTDGAAQATMLQLARTALPPEYLEATSHDGIEALVGYLRGDRDDLDWTVSLHDPLRAALLSEGAAPSALERTWTELGLTELAIAGLAETTVLPSVEEFGLPPEAAPQLALLDGSTGLTDSDPLALLVGDGSAEAGAWLEAELFGAVRELGGYLVGDTEHVAIDVQFDSYPELAPVLATALNTDPRTLQRDGFRLNDRDIQRELDASEDPPIASLDEARAIFTPAGRTFGLDDFERGDQAEGGGSSNGFSLDAVRAFTAPATRWGVPVGATVVLWLAVAIGFLGGRSWWSRAAWGAAPVLGASLLIAIGAGPVFSLVASPALGSAFVDARLELLSGGSTWAPLGVRALAELERTVNAQAGALATNAALVALLAATVAGAAVAWRIYRSRTPLTADPLPLPVSEPTSEDETQLERAA